MAKIYDIEKQVNLLYRLKLWLEEVYGKNVDKIQEYKDICEHLDSIDLKEIKKMIKDERQQLLVDKAKLNTEVAIYIIKNQTLKNEIEDLRIENRKLEKIIANLENDGAII